MSNSTQKIFLKRQLSLYRDLLDGNATWDDINKLRKEYGYAELTIDSLRRNFQLLRMYDEEGFLNENGWEKSRKVVVFLCAFGSFQAYNWAEMLIPLAHIFVSQIQIGLLSHRHA